jgi:hypothetical protein
MIYDWPCWESEYYWPPDHVAALHLLVCLYSLGRPSAMHLKERQCLLHSRVSQENESSGIAQPPYKQWRDRLLYTPHFQNQAPVLCATLHGLQKWWMSCWHASLPNTYDLDVVSVVHSCPVSKRWATASGRNSWECCQQKIFLFNSGYLLLHTVAKLG